MLPADRQIACGVVEIKFDAFSLAGILFSTRPKTPAWRIGIDGPRELH
jgi:hypothetical protein